MFPPSLSCHLELISRPLSQDMILECVSENIELKKKIFGLIHKVIRRRSSPLIITIDPFLFCPQVAKKDAIITSNTSSISITKLAAMAGEGRAENFVGMHFFNPVPVMKLVEVMSYTCVSFPHP